MIPAVCLCIGLCPGTAVQANIPMDTLLNKQRVLQFYKLIVGQRKAELIPAYVLENYKQHNPTMQQGRAGVAMMISYLKTLPQPAANAPSPMVRAIQEGDFVVTHLDVQFMGKRMGVIDLFRLEGGMLAEHWDAIQELQSDDARATSGTTIIDGKASAENSKWVVAQFYEAIINKKAADEFIKPGYTEHDAMVISGGNGLIMHLQQDPDRQIKLHKIIAEGDFVVVQSQYNSKQKAYVRYEIFRVENNRIAERWAVEQAVPEGVAAGDMF